MEERKVTLTIIRNFESLNDPRILLKTAHKLIDVLVIAICAVICGADKWTQVEEFGNAHKEWLKQYLELHNGIPSHDTFGRVFAAINPEHFQKCFAGWIKDVFALTEGQVIAIDGKTLRRSHDKKSNKAALHMVHAWATANGVLLGQVKSKEKSNEITAIPELLETLMIKGCIITIDAMGCQRKIAEKIYDCKADYVLSVKDNQGRLKQSLEKTFTIAREKNFEAMVYDYHQTIDGDHGRIETRSYYVLPLMYLFNFKIKWKGLQSLILVENERINKATNEKAIEKRYYISSIKYDAAKIASITRKHWSIENNLHWCLDVGFREDECRVRIGDAAENFSLVRRIALMLLKKEISFKGGIQTKRLKAAWDMSYLLKVLAC